MNISLSAVETCTIIRVEGRIDTLTSPQLEEALTSLTNKGHYALVIDLAKVDYLSSSAFRIFVKFHKLCRSNDDQIILQGVQPNLMGLFKISGFDKLFCFTNQDQDSLTIIGQNEPN